MKLEHVNVAPSFATYPKRERCKGDCHSLERSRPYRNPYLEHCYCRTCSVWLQLAALLPHKRFGFVCPCCNKRPKMKSYRKTPTELKAEKDLIDQETKLLNETNRPTTNPSD